MKFIVKEIGSSKKEIRVTIHTTDIEDTPGYIFGTIDGGFDENTIDKMYIPKQLSSFYSIGPNPAIIRLVVGYLKDVLGSYNEFKDLVLNIGNKKYIPILNLAVDDISLVDLNNDTIPSIVIKLAEEVPNTLEVLSEVQLETQIFNIQEQNLYYVPKSPDLQELRGLDYDEGMIEEVGNQDVPNLEFESYNELTSSFGHVDKTIIADIISGSDVNLKVDYRHFQNHVHFGSAVSKLENFKEKLVNIEKYLTNISSSLNTSSLASDSLNKVDDLRVRAFASLQDEKNTFTSYEKEVYYNSSKLNFNSTPTLGKNYVGTSPLVKGNQLLNYNGFDSVYKVSGSDAIPTQKYIPLFTDKYRVENKPFYNDSGSFYLSFLMTGDEPIKYGAVNNINWVNNQKHNVPKLPKPTLYTSSLLEPNVKSGSWQRYIYLASSSYWKPHSTKPIIGAPGSITDFDDTDEIDILHGSGITGSLITVGGRYSNLATYVTSSGHPFTGSIAPAGELFRISINTEYNSNITSSYLTDIKITKHDPRETLPFADVYPVSSTEFKKWYDEQYESASLFDQNNIHSLMNNLPEYLGRDNVMDNGTFRKFVNMTGEYFDLIKSYIDNYESLFRNDYDEFTALPNNLIPTMANNYNWRLKLPFGNTKDGSLKEFLGTTLSSDNNTNDVKNNIWRNLLNNIKYMYSAKGTQSSIRTLLNSYGFPPDILKLREHGASLESFDNSALSDDIANTEDSLSNSTGSVSFTQKAEKMVTYILDNTSRQIGTEWRRDSVDANAIEFVVKTSRGTNTQTLLQSSGSTDKKLWDLILEPSGTDDRKGKLTFRLSNVSNGSADLSVNAISMSSGIYKFKNQNFWNVLLQRTTGPSGSDTYVSHSYQLLVGESNGDKINTIQSSTMDYGGTVYANAAANFIGTGSRNKDTGGNLVIGGDIVYPYTGSIAEVRTWKQALSSSKFRQHIYDKKSVVGNSLTDSQTNLIYHYRLNENWKSGSIAPTIKDSNKGNLKDYSISIPNAALENGELYDLDEYDRIQFNIRMGGAQETSENNIIIDSERRFIDNLNPFGPSFLSVYEPLINKRKASSIVEIVRSPQDVINDFILNQLGNFDFNDKFADPQDINEPLYKDLEVFSKQFFDYYNISMDVNEYIRSQAAIFNSDLIDSIKRLTPARTTIGKMGVELKPTFLERQKITNSKLQQELIGVGPGDVFAIGNRPATDHSKNTIMGITVLDNLHLADETKKGHLAISTYKNEQDFQSGSLVVMEAERVVEKQSELVLVNSENKKDFQSGSLVIMTVEQESEKQAHLAISTHKNEQDWQSGSLVILSEEVNSPILSTMELINPEMERNYQSGSLVILETEMEDKRNIDFGIASHTGSTPSFNYTLDKYKLWHIEVSSHTGSNPILTETVSTPRMTKFSIASSTGSIPQFTYDLKLSDDVSISIASSTGSIPEFDYELDTNRDVGFTVASSTGSIPSFNYTMDTPKDMHLEIASATGSTPTISKVVDLTRDTKLEILTHENKQNFQSGSLVVFDFQMNNSHNTDLDISIGDKNNKGVVLWDYENYQYINSDIEIASHTGSNPTLTEIVKQPKLWHLEIASATGSNPTLSSELFVPKKGVFDFVGNDSFLETLTQGYVDLSKKWGTGVNDVHFIHTSLPGKDGDYNTYHYENRYIYNMVGDVESISGSVSGKTFNTDYTGTITSNVYTASVDFKNKTFISSDIGLGRRPLGTTAEFLPSSSIDFNGGKFLDEVYVYPSNHIFVIGTSRDSINTLIYDGTKNTNVGSRLESEAFIDASDDPIYSIPATGGEGYYTP